MGCSNSTSDITSDDKRLSLVPGSIAVINKQQEWLKNERSALKEEVPHDEIAFEAAIVVQKAWRGKMARRSLFMRRRSRSHKGTHKGSKYMANKRKGMKLENDETTSLLKSLIADFVSGEQAKVGGAGAGAGAAGATKTATTTTEAAESNGALMTFEDLKALFLEMNLNLDLEMLKKIFLLFDANGDGLVDRTEFSVALLFLLNKGSSKTNEQVAFRLFDTNRSGFLSKKEFDMMIKAVIGNSLASLLSVNEWKDIFRKHLKKEFSEENLLFWEKIEGLKQQVDDDSKSKKTVISFKKAENICKTFISQQAPFQVNISDHARTEIESALNSSSKSKEKEIPLDIFFQAQREVYKLMEGDNFTRFKQKIHTEYSFADGVWDSMKIPSTDSLDLSTFSTWARHNQGVFKFLEDLQAQFS